MDWLKKLTESVTEIQQNLAQGTESGNAVSKTLLQELKDSLMEKMSGGQQVPMAPELEGGDANTPKDGGDNNGSADPPNEPQIIFRYPGGGDVDMSHYHPVTTWFSRMFQGALSQIGFVNVYNMESASQDMEQSIIGEVGSYGRQLGRVIEALQAVCGELPNLEQNQAVTEFKELAERIDKFKSKNMVKYRRPLTQEMIDELAEEIQSRYSADKEEVVKIIIEKLQAMDKDRKSKDS